MTIVPHLLAPQPSLSYEIFPPRTDAAEANLELTLRQLAPTRPEFISVTYGASGTTRGSSREAVARVISEFQLPTLAHVTCVDQSKQELIGVIEENLELGVRDFLALRGDPPRGQANWQPHPDGLHYAYQLVALIKEVAAIHGIQVAIGVTAFPAQHADERLRAQGLEVLRAKQDAGADFAITQVFYEAQQYVALVKDGQQAGIEIPILPEVMPLTSLQRAHRAAELTGVPTPAALVKAITQAESDADVLTASVDFAADFAAELVSAGAPGVHIITFNQAAASLALVEKLGWR